MATVDEVSDAIPCRSDKMDVASLSQAALRSVMDLIKTSNELVTGKEDYDLYNTFDKFRHVMQVEMSSLKNLMSKILTRQCLRVNLDKTDVDEMFDALVEANDIILERVGVAIDEATGQRKIEDPILITAIASKTINTSWNKRVNTHDKKDPSTYRLLTAKNIIRPQLAFRVKIDNRSGPFEPIIKEKPHSIKPLAIILEQTEYGEMFSHPYQCELDHFKPQVEHLQRAVLSVPKDLKDTPFTFVENNTQLNELVTYLKSQHEFAVDLEHHSYRTFQGITCLMQISTRERDYIIDVLQLRDELGILNEVFTDPKILKVLHGADKDIVWLQRDFGVYIVNMFDTGQASRVLSFAHYSLAFLLKHYCQVEANKQFQLADWRIRPLPEEMIHYAREDTHYLLYVYDCMKNELLDKGNSEKNLLLSVFQRSKQVCEKRYVKFVFNPEGYMELCKKSRRILNSQQMYALKELYAWRDSVARKEDESIGYVLPNHMLLQIAEVLPREMQGILACCNPVPTMVRQNLNELHQIILRAREQSLIKPVTQQLQIQVDESRQQVDLENVFHCPHDFSHLKDMGSIDAEPTLLDLWNEFGDDVEKELTLKIPSSIILKEMPSIPELANDNVLITDKSAKTRIKEVMSSFRAYNSPFDRYKLVKPVLSKDVSDSSQLNSSSQRKECGVETVEEHFKQLVKIHGKRKPDGSPIQQPSHLDNSAEEKRKDKAKEQASEVSEETVVADDEPIRKKFKLKNKKKNKQKNLKCTKGDTDAQKPKRQKVNIDESTFQAFDYSQTDAKIFQGDVSKRKGRKHFDPNQEGPEYKTGGKSKSKLRDKTKSMTYTSKKTFHCSSKFNTQKPKR